MPQTSRPMQVPRGLEVAQASSNTGIDNCFQNRARSSHLVFLMRLRIMIFWSRSYMWPDAIVKMWMVSGSSSGASRPPFEAVASLLEDPPNQLVTPCRSPPDHGLQ